MKTLLMILVLFGVSFNSMANVTTVCDMEGHCSTYVVIDGRTEPNVVYGADNVPHYSW